MNQSDFLSPRTRRGFMRAAGKVTLVSFGGGLIAACGGDDAARSGSTGGGGGPGTIKLGGYEGWIGDKEYELFAKQHPGSRVEEVVINVDAERIAKLATDPSVVDIMLITEADVDRLVKLGVAQKVDLEKVPNYKNIDEPFKIGYAADSKAMAVATDYGKTGFGYRTDMVDEELGSWADVWDVAPKYSGKITFLDYNMQTIPSVLKMLGSSVSTTDEAEIEAAGQKLIEIKPHLQSFTSSNMTKGLLDGSVAIAMDWDYDMFGATQENHNIKWVNPTEGMLGYLDTWVAINTSKHLNVVWQFMNFHFDPKNYANFVNTTGTASCMQAARAFVDPAIAESSVMYPGDEVLNTVEFGKPVGEAQAIYDKVWQDVKAA